MQRRLVGPYVYNGSGVEACLPPVSRFLAPDKRAVGIRPETRRYITYTRSGLLRRHMKIVKNVKPPAHSHSLHRCAPYPRVPHL